MCMFEWQFQCERFGFHLIKVCCVLKDFSLFKVSSFSEAHSTQPAFLLVLSGEEDSGVRRQCGMEGDNWLQDEPPTRRRVEAAQHLFLFFHAPGENEERSAVKHRHKIFECASSCPSFYSHCLTTSYNGDGSQQCTVQRSRCKTLKGLHCHLKTNQSI